MLLKECLAEFVFHCQYRKLSLLNFLQAEHELDELEQVAPRHIKEFLAAISKKGRKPSYVNDLLKAFKVFFRYLSNR